MADDTLGWERLAARPGGTVAGLATATAADGATLVFAATSAGVYRSADDGRTWTPTSAGHSVAFNEVVAPSPDFARDRTVFVGGRTGLYRSVDGGTSWVPVLAGGRVLSLALARDTRRTSTLFAGIEGDGILRSDDGGRTWAGANAGLLDLTVLALALSPEFGQDGLGFAATTSGLYRTRNGGKAWRAVDLAADDVAAQCLSVSPGFVEDRLVLAGTESDGLLRSDDAGGRWEPVSGLGARSVTAVAFSSRYPACRTIAAATELGLALSADGGRSWRITATDLEPVLTLCFVPRAGGETLLAGLHRDGVARVAAGGGTWTLANAGLQARLLVSLMLSPAFEADHTVFAAGPDDGVIVSTDGGRTWAAHLVGPGDLSVFGLVPSPDYARDRTLYAATATGIHRSRDGGTTWQPAPTGAEPGVASVVIAGPPVGDGTWPVLAALAEGQLLASDDQGESWRSLGDDLLERRPNAKIVSLALSPAYARDRTIFVGTHSAGRGDAGEATLWRSVDGGMHWQRWLIERGGDLLPLAVPPRYPLDEVVFVGLGGRVLKPLRHAREVRSGERRPIWRGVDVGAEGASVTALATPPDAGAVTTIFAATSKGMCISRDGGEHFRAWGDGLGAAVAVAVSPSYARDRLVYALGLGGALWRRRDV